VDFHGILNLFLPIATEGCYLLKHYPLSGVWGAIAGTNKEIRFFYPILKGSINRTLD
jgi:hypothetical protein